MSASIATVPSPHAVCSSLFLHLPLAYPNHRDLEQFARRRAHFARYGPETTQAAYSASPPLLNTANLVATLNDIRTGTLLVITGEAITADGFASKTRVVLGAFMPTPWDLERQRAFRASPPRNLDGAHTPDHMFFQLEPCQRVLWPEAGAWIMDLIEITNSDPERGTKGSIRFGAEGASGLSVDLDNGTATFRSIASSTRDSTDRESVVKPISSYHTIDSSEAPAADWSSSLRVRNLSLYDMGGDAILPFEKQAPPPKTSYPAPPSVSEVGDEELRKRIQGFGSSD